MKSVALEKAHQHLELAREAASYLTLYNGFRPYEEAWSQFLSQVSRFYSEMEQGAKGCKVSAPWFGKKKHERKKYELLSYIHHARNSDEHSLERITSRSADLFSYQSPKEFGDFSAEFMLECKDDGTFRTFDPKLTLGDGTVADLRSVNPRIVLRDVKDDLHNDVFKVPTTHLGKPLRNPSPEDVALLTIEYLERFLADAEKLPKGV